MPRGYWGVALYEPKFEENWGMIVRSAYNFGANFIATIGHRYKRDCLDTTDGTKHIPTFHFKNTEDFLESIDKRCILIGVEVNGKSALETYSHPENACYIFGGEDKSLPEGLMQFSSIRIETNRCLNISVAASIVLYDRHLKQTWRK